MCNAAHVRMCALGGQIGLEVVALLDRYVREGGNSDAPGHFVAWLVEQVPAVAARFEGRWSDIGSHETLAEARRIYGGPADPAA